MITSWLASLDAAQLATLARRYQTLARADGGFVILADGAEVAIPPLVTPVVMSAQDRKALAKDARLLVAATDRLARALIAGPETELKARTLSSLSPLEREAMLHTHTMGELATARVDFLVDTSGVARALEINTTIPAMQGYSDAIAGAFLRAVGEQRGLADDHIRAAIDANGRNTDDLLASLLELHARAGGATESQRIAIVARVGDSQGGELDHYVRRWSALGHHAFRCTPDEIERDGRVAGAAVDLFYRHVFLRRLDPDGAFAGLLRSPRTHHVWNPPASHLELKSMLGLLSAAVDQPGSLPDDERVAVTRRLPWTRLCMSGSTRGPDGTVLADLLDFVLAHPALLVLKRSWDYGGRGVFLGAELDSGSSQAKLCALLGSRDRPYAWHDLVQHVTHASDAWVVQALVDVTAQPRLRIDDVGVVEHSLYADISAFTSLGGDVRVEGGAVRASEGRIVNIQGGGGLAPLLREAAVEKILR